jgi:hypothetical protein
MAAGLDLGVRSDEILTEAELRELLALRAVSRHSEAGQANMAALIAESEATFRRCEKLARRRLRRAPSRMPRNRSRHPRRVRRVSRRLARAGPDDPSPRARLRAGVSAFQRRDDLLRDTAGCMCALPTATTRIPANSELLETGCTPFFALRRRVSLGSCTSEPPQGRPNSDHVLGDQGRWNLASRERQGRSWLANSAPALLEAETASTEEGDRG